MKNLIKILPVIALLMTITFAQAQTGPLPSEVVKAVKSGDADSLKPYLNSKVELLLPGESGVYSKEQAHFILKSFLKKTK